MSRSMTETAPATSRAPALDAAALLAVAPVIAAALRLWLYSGGDTAVLLTLISTLDIAAILIGTGIQILPGAVILLIIALITDWRFRDSAAKWAGRNPWIRFCVLPLLIVIVITAPILLLVPALILLIVPPIIFSFIRNRWRWGQRIADLLVAPRGDPNGPNSVVSFTVIGIFVLMSGFTMWLPLERVESEGAPDGQYSGYVLESDETWTTILTRERNVVILETHDVNRRVACGDPYGPRISDFFIFPTKQDPIDSCAEEAESRSSGKIYRPHMATPRALLDVVVA